MYSSEFPCFLFNWISEKWFLKTTFWGLTFFFLLEQIRNGYFDYFARVRHDSIKHFKKSIFLLHFKYSSRLQNHTLNFVEKQILELRKSKYTFIQFQACRARLHCQKSEQVESWLFFLLTKIVVSSLTINSGRPSAVP